jgi:hypothetical protein
MTARFPWSRYSSVRRIEKRASRTADPVERLRYLRNQMDSRELPEQFGWWSVTVIRIAAAIAAAMGAALPVWRIR